MFGLKHTLNTRVKVPNRRRRDNRRGGMLTELDVMNVHFLECHNVCPFFASLSYKAHSTDSNTAIANLFELALMFDL
ncbi:hypothetical protein SAMN05661109_00238 [Corynebacterium cystitidis DSM 20524]|uniref:Uncharacterized protein n=1 Tax=Corynebacterium cystitidis DSM 20524 TaxID=1121357 RepID=A0A1H9P7M7_9CORY|nr:hypothetical protein SAMN05661109_00238 [Corynebacterium cystitidis DSM 20524]